MCKSRDKAPSRRELWENTGENWCPYMRADKVAIASGINPMLEEPVLPVLLIAGAAFAGDTYKIDEGHSAVLFKAHHFNAGYTWGRFNEFAGQWEVDGKTLTAIKVKVKAESVDTNIEKRDKHLRSPDYLDVEAFPEITFESKSVKCADSGCEVAGTLMLHGVSKDITTTLTHTGEGKDPWGGYRQGWEGVFTIDTKDFGIQQEGVGTNLQLTVAFEGKK
jgi:polyisoprenoid-binding protein YceI